MASSEASEPVRCIPRKPVPLDSSSHHGGSSLPSASENAELLATVDRHPHREDNDVDASPTKPQPTSEVKDDPRVTMWNPLILHPLSLIGMAGVFITLFATVLVLYFYSQAKHGIANQVPSNHYSWKYGPMAVVVLVAGIWHQVDYYCKVLAPWQSLLHGPNSVDRTILSDYISPLAPVVCVQAIRNRHWAVVASTAGALLLDLALVFSTAFLVLLPVTQNDSDKNIDISSKFVNATILRDESAPAMIVWGNFKHGLSLPFGTTESLAFATPALDSDHGDSELLMVDVPAFVPQFECEAAPVSVNSSLVGTGLSLQATVSTPTCDLFTNFIDGGDVLHEVMPPRILTASGADVSLCGDGQQTDPSFLPWPFIVTDVRYWQTFGPSQDGNLNVTRWYAKLANATAIVCQPRYALRNASFSIDVSDREVLNSRILNDDPRQTLVQIDGFNNTHLSSGVSNVFNTLWQVLQPAWSHLDLTVQNNNDAMFTLMSMLNDSYNLEEFLDPTIMSSAASHIFNRVAAQMAHYKLSEASTSIVLGTKQYVKLRVFAERLPTIIMCFVFGLLTMLSIIILIIRARDVVFQPPNSIITQAAILAASENLQSQLKNAGSLSDKELGHVLYGRNFGSVTKREATTHGFEIQPDDEEVRTHTPGSAQEWWYPFAAKTYFVVVIVTLNLSIIAGLEIIRHLSDSTSGFIQLNISQTAAATWSTTVPAAVMMVTRLLFQSLAFSIMVFAPYAMLSRTKGSSYTVTTESTVGQASFVSSWLSIRARQPAALLVSVTMIMGSFLTIIVSGLFSVEQFGLSSSVVVQTLDAFDPTWNATGPDGKPNDNQAGNVFTVIDWDNLSYPPLTYNELVFPNMKLLDVTATQDSNGTRIRLAIPATRAALKCSFAVPGRATSIYAPEAPGPGGYDVMVQGNQVKVSGACTLTSKPQVVNTTTNRPAEIFDLHGEYFSARNEYPWSSNKSGYGVCPDFGFTFGFTGRHSNNTQNISSLTCYQSIEEVDTITTFLWPSLVVDPKAPPVIDEGSIRIIKPLANYDISTIIDNEFGSFTYAPIEPFFRHLLNGSEFASFFDNDQNASQDKSFADLLGPENQDRLFAAVQHVYRKYMAQAINLNMRKPVTTSRAMLHARDSGSSSKTYPATFLNPNGLCLVQNSAPRIALEAILATMMLCTLVAYLLTPMRNVLPHNPLTIAGTMSLLAGGSLAKKRAQGGFMPEGAEFLTMSQLRVMLEQHDPASLRMGWWRSDGIAIAKPAERKTRRWNRTAKSKEANDVEDETLAAGSYFGIDLAKITLHSDRVPGVAERESRTKAEVSANARLLVPDLETGQPNSERASL